MNEYDNQFEHLLELSDECILIFLENTILYINSKAKKTLRIHDSENISERDIGSFFHQDFKESILANLSEDTKKHEWEIKMLRSDGSEFDSSIRISNIKFHEKDSSVMFFQDKTQLNHVLEKLNKFYIAVSNSPISIVITDKNGTIEYVNPRFLEESGYTMDEAIGKNPRMFKSGLTPRETYKDLWKTILAGNIWIGEFYNRKKNEELYWERTSISPIMNDFGDITHFISIKENITDQKKMERLKQDTDKLLIHDLKNLLNGIMGLSQLFSISKNVSKNNMLKWSSLISNSCTKMIDLINSSVDLFHMEEGTYVRKMEHINLLGILEQFDQEFQHLLEAKSLVILLQINNSLPNLNEKLYVFGENIHIKNLFTNLMKNAIEASPDGKKITVDIYTEDPVYYEIDIHNWGTIPESMRENFFDRYSTVGKIGGTGIGTYSAYLIVKAHAGKIDFTSSEESGTALKVFLPKDHL